MTINSSCSNALLLRKNTERRETTAINIGHEEETGAVFSEHINQSRVNFFALRGAHVANQYRGIKEIEK